MFLMNLRDAGRWPFMRMTSMQCGLPQALCGCFSHVSLSPKIEECENEHPDQIDEMPVEPHDFDVLVATPAAGEEAGPSDGVVSTPDLPRHDDEEDHPDRHMRAVEAGDHEESRTELRRAPRIAPGSYPFGDQLGPFEGLHADEGGSQRCSQKHEDCRFAAVAAIAEIDRHGHRSAARDQHEGHDGDQDQWNVRSADTKRK